MRNSNLVIAFPFVSSENFIKIREVEKKSYEKYRHILTHSVIRLYLNSKRLKILYGFHKEFFKCIQITVS